AGGDGGRADVEPRRGGVASGGRGAGGGAAARAARVGAALVLGRALCVGWSHRVGRRLLGLGPGDVRGARRRTAARQRPAGGCGNTSWRLGGWPDSRVQHAYPSISVRLSGYPPIRLFSLW